MSGEVEQREKEHPYDIDKVPVKAGDLNGHIIAIFVSPPPREEGQHQHDYDPYRHMNRVQPRHREIEPEKDFRALRIRLRPDKTGARHKMIGEILMIFEPFYHHKNDPE